MRVLLTLILSLLTLAAQGVSAPPFGFWVNIPAWKSVAINDAADHLWMNDAAGTAFDTAPGGGQNIAYPAGFTDSQTGLLINATNFSATVTAATSTAHLTMSTGTVWDDFTVSNRSWEFWLKPNVAHVAGIPISGGTVSYPILGKTDASYVGWAFLLVNSDLTTVAQSNWMCAELYMNDGSHFYRSGGACDISNGNTVHIVYTWKTNRDPRLVIYGDGNKLNMFSGSNGTVGNVTSSSRRASLYGATDGTSFGNYAGGVGPMASYPYCLTDNQIQAHFLAGRGYALNTNSYAQSSMRLVDLNGVTYSMAAVRAYWVAASNVYYIFGIEYTNADYSANIAGTLYPDQANTNISLFSSPNMMPGSFTRIGFAMSGAQVPNSNFGSISGVSWGGLNASTGKYVLMSHAGCGNASFQYISNFIAIAESTTATGNYTLAAGLNPQGSTNCGDVVLLADGANGYIAYTKNGGGGASGIFGSALTSDWHSTTGPEVTIGSGSVEAPMLFKIGSTFVCIYSTVEFYDSRQMLDVQYSTATSFAGPWTQRGSLYQSGFPARSGYASQSGGGVVLADGTVWYLGEHWYAGRLGDSPTITTKLIADSSVTFHLETNANILYGQKFTSP